MKIDCLRFLTLLSVFASFAPLSIHAAAERECRNFLEEVDQIVDRAGVRDAQEDRVKGHSYLRTNRFLASRVDQNLTDPQLDFLLQQMRRLDLNARRIETNNLPMTPRELLDNIRSKSFPEQIDVTGTLDECGKLLLAVEKPSWGKLHKQISAPMRYSLFSRLIGFYPITAIPFSRGIRKFQAKMTQTFAAPLSAVIDDANVTIHTPPAGDPGDIAAILREASDNPLHIPMPSNAQLAQLYAHFAPSFAIDTRGDFDRPGAVGWSDAGRIEIDRSTVRVYTLASHMAFEGQALLQLNYIVWFSERPKKGQFDMLGGALDGLIWRVTLASDGTPVLHDTIHPCGCYHLFFPSEKLRAKPPHPSLQEHAYVPQALPRLNPGERHTVWIESATHYVVRVTNEAMREGAPYVFSDYDELRSLAKSDGTRRSLFRPDGLVDGTERGERLFFWPMGIASAGAMRQWGHHATAFVGRRHFDDADLIEKAFAAVTN